MTEPGAIRSRLSNAGRAIKFSTLVLGALWWLTLSLGAWLALFLLDNLFALPGAIRFPLAVSGGLFLLIGFARKVAIPALHDVSPERTAVAIEQSRAMGDNLLINACQLEAQSLAPGERLFASRTLDGSAQVMDSIPEQSFWKRKVLVKWGLAAGGFAVLWIAYGVIFPRQTLNALSRYVAPLGDVPPAGSVSLDVTPASDVVVNEGADLAVSAVVGARTESATGALAPIIAWAEGRRMVTPARSANDTAAMLENGQAGRYQYAFRSIQRSFSFRVLVADTYSRSVQVTVLPRPRILSSVFRVRPPAYTGLGTRESVGPPSPVSCLPLSALEIQIGFDQPLSGVTWTCAKSSSLFHEKKEMWTANVIVTNGGPFSIDVRRAKQGLPASVAEGEVQLETDRAPEVEFVTDNSNLFVTPGTELPLTVRASDDFGMSNLTITCRSGNELAGTNDVRRVRAWGYAGPPGNPGPVRESFTLGLDPRVFVPGETYLLEAESSDFRPGGRSGRSRPMVLRVKSVADLALPGDDVLADAMNRLKKTIAEQKRANETTDNLRTHVDEAVENKRVPVHRDSMEKQQESARSAGQQAVSAFRSFPSDGKTYADRLSLLVDSEMRLALEQIAAVKGMSTQALPPCLAKIGDRQAYILNELIALLGTISSERTRKDKAVAGGAGKDVVLPPALRDENAASLADELGTFERAQKEIIKASKALQDKRPEDLTDEDKGEIAGALAREEAEWAKFLEEKLTDFAKLPLQDFGDGSVARQLNEVIQDVDKAAEALYQKKVDLAVPMEQSGLEKAEELVHNIEKWLSNKPDNLKWSMEEPGSQADIPLAELPAEMEDIVGELLDKEEDMQQDVEDVSSSWLDSIDKGAGWDAADGPISSMSAKGVTGNLLPNKQEIGGRSGEGRSGKSNGQMVQDSAEGKGGRETPTRLSPSPFEPGNVKDSDKTDSGGATGGGKLSGFGEAGLRGPTAPPPPEKMARIAGNQAQVRQQAEALSLKLRKYKLPSGDVEAAVVAMKDVEESAGRQDGLRVRRSYHTAVDALEEARKDIRAEVGLHRERARLPESALREIMMGLQDGIPKGYEELVADYFRRMAGDTR